MSFADSIRANPALEKLTEDLKKVNSGFSPLMMLVSTEYGDIAERHRDRKEKNKKVLYPDERKAYLVYEAVNHGCKSIIHYYQKAVNFAVEYKRPLEGVGTTLLECAEKTKEELEVAEKCGLSESEELAKAYKACDELEALAKAFIEEQKQGKTR